MVTFISILLAVLLVWYSFRALGQPGFALAIIWSMYASEQLLQQGHPIFVRAASSINILFTLVCLAAVLNALRKGKYRHWRMTPEAWFCAGLFLLAAASILWSVSPKDSSKWLMISLPYIAAFMLVSPLCAIDQKQLQLAVSTTVFLGGIILLGHAFSTYSQGARGLTFVVGTQEVGANPLAVAGYAGYVGICALFSVYGRKFSPLIALKIGILLLAAFVIFRSKSRGQLIALVLVSFIWLPIIAKATLKRSTVIALAGSALIICGSIYTFNNMIRDTGRWRSGNIERATEGRLAMSAELLTYWVDAGPLTWLAGTGNSSSFKIVGFYPHNVPAEVLGEEGLIGFGLLAAFCITVLRRASKMMFSKELTAETRVNLGILLAIFCFEGILTLKQGSLLGSVGWFGMGITLGWLAIPLNAQAKRSIWKRKFGRRAYPQMQFPSPVEP